MININDLPKDFGGFDHRFLGVILRFHSTHPHALKTLGSYAKSSPEERLKLFSAAATLGSKHSFEFLSLVTSIDHEVRHYHDMLLSPFGNAMFRMRLTCVLNGFQWLFKVLQKGIHFLPVPVSRWDELLNAEYKYDIDLDTKKMFDAISRIYCDSETKEIGQKILSTYSNMENIANMKFDERLPVNSIYVAELSAVIIQLQSIYSGLGVGAAESFINTLTELPQLSHYNLLYRLLYDLWIKNNSSIELNLMGAITSWAYLGDVFGYHLDDSPATRFIKLFYILNNSKLPDPSKDPKALFDFWSQKLGCSTVEEALVKNIATNKKFIERLELQVENYPEYMLSTVHTVLQSCRYLASSNEYMVNEFLANPNGYISPLDYLENISRYVSAPIQIDFLGSGQVKEKDELKPENILRAFTHKSDPEKLIIFSYILNEKTPGIELIELSNNIEILRHISIVDHIFDTSNRQANTHDISRDILRDMIGITPMEII